MPSSTALRSTAMASSWSSGGPQMPEPVMRMAPKPRRRTGRSPRSMVPAVVSSRALASSDDGVVGVMVPFYPPASTYPSLARPDLRGHDRGGQQGAVGNAPQQVAGAIDADDLEASGP